MIRRAEPEDADKIREVARITWKATYKDLIPEAIQEQFLAGAYSDQHMRIRINQTIFFVAEQDGDIIGFANALIKEGCAELSAIYVLPTAQGRGVGSGLLRAIMSRLGDVSQMIAEVEAGNVLGERFYRAKGFKVMKEYDENFIGYLLKTKSMQLNLYQRAGES